MGLLEAIFYINIFLGILAAYYYAKQKGEIYVADLTSLLLIIAFGSFTFWVHFYDEYNVQIHAISSRLKKLGKKPIWRSKATIAKEVLFGDKKDE